jgi:hypothetical protein
MAESGCVGCDASHPCGECAKRAHASGEIDGMEDSRRTLPMVQRQRTVTGGHRAVVIVDERAHVPASGELDEDTREFMQGLRDLRPEDRRQALNEYMRAQRASEEQTRAALAALAQGGLATLQQHLESSSEERLQRINQAGETERERIRQQTRLALAQIAARSGRSLDEIDPDGASSGTSNPNTGMQTTTTTTTETPATGLSTGAKVAIGVGAGAVVLTAAYLLWQSAEKRRREEEERRRRDEEFRLRMLQAGAR